MRWNNHSRLKDQHAFLSPSQHQWLRYDEEKLKQVYLNRMAAQIGTERHAFAAEAIRLKIKLQLDPKHPDTLAMYVNDAIDEGMDPEVVLYFNTLAFGTADAIFFDERTKVLKIFDLKTGSNQVAKEAEDGSWILEQVEIYAAIFCLEYGYEPIELIFDLRIYQNEEVFCEKPDPDRIYFIMNDIIHKSEYLYSMGGDRIWRR